MNQASMGGLTEVKLGELAEQKSSNPDVKAFAEMMVREHSDANNKLQPILSQQGLSAPTEVSEKNKQVVDRLAKMSGRRFDKSYVEQMVADHEKTIKLFEKESTSGKVSEAKSFASDTLPTLRHHLEEARRVQSSLK